MLAAISANPVAPQNHRYNNSYTPHTFHRADPELGVDDIERTPSERNLLILWFFPIRRGRQTNRHAAFQGTLNSQSFADEGAVRIGAVGLPERSDIRLCLF